MRIHGYNATSLVDYPGKVSFVIFSQVCNLRCFYCHNKALQSDEGTGVPYAEVFTEIERRGKLIDGIVVTGGEPTIYDSLPSFLKQLKLLNLPIKLDTNGTSQTILQQVIDEKLVDYIAMDVKATKLKYARAAGAMVGIAGINRTIEMIKNSGIDYEFRTTIVPSLHEEADIREIAEWISPAKRWALQQFRPGIWQENSYPAAQLERFAEIARNVGKFGEVIVRHA